MGSRSCILMKKKSSTLKPGKAIHHAPVARVSNGIVSIVIDDRDVRIMSVAEGYAMVRRKGAMPYVCMADELSQ